MKHEAGIIFTRGTRGSGGRWGSSSRLLTIRLIPCFSAFHEHEADCLLPFDTRSATNAVALEHYLVDRLEKLRAQCAANAHGRINDAASDPIDGMHFAALSASPRSPREMMHERPVDGIRACRPREEQRAVGDRLAAGPGRARFVAMRILRGISELEYFRLRRDRPGSAFSFQLRELGGDSIRDPGFDRDGRSPYQNPPTPPPPNPPPLKPPPPPPPNPELLELLRGATFIAVPVTAAIRDRLPVKA